MRFMAALLCALPLHAASVVEPGKGVEPLPPAAATVSPLSAAAGAPQLAPLAAVPNLPEVPAASPSAPSLASPAEAGQKVSPEIAASGVGAMFDGVKPVPPYLSVADPDARAWLGSVLDEAANSRTARGVLRKVAAMAERRGRPVVVTQEPMRKNFGEYVWDWEVLRMNASYRALEPISAVHTLIHELVHALQKEMGLPLDALELELEAHVIGLKVLNELGVRPTKGSFEASAEKEFLRKTASEFAAWVKESYETNISLAIGPKAYEAELRKRLAKSERRVKRLEKQLARNRAILEGMISSGQPPTTIDSYRADEVTAVEASIKDELSARKWLDRDLALLADPSARARIVAFGRRVRRWMARTSLD